MRTIDQAGDLNGKTVLMRADFDVPVRSLGEGGRAEIQEAFRIQRQKPMLEYLLAHGARVVLAAHISAVPSFEPLKSQLEQLLGVSFGDRVELRENLRSNPGEEANDRAFAEELVRGCDLYVNNAFAVCHRAHASVATVPTLLPAYAGLLIEEETRELSKVIDAPAEGKIIYMGGAKVSTKLPVIQYLMDKSEHIAVGGKLANELKTAPDQRVLMPTDFVMDGADALDIGAQTSARYAGLAHDAKLIVWNGPMGKFEDERYRAATRVVAEAIAASSAYSVVGGGDTIAAIDMFGLRDRFGFVSTGGGAMLAFLAGQRLPGLEALGYYHD